jgi:hypothetical protein
MSLSLRKVAATASLAVAATALTLPVAAPANAVAATEKAFVSADLDHDDFYGLYKVSTPYAQPLAANAVVSESLPVDISQVSTSRDGSRVIYVQDNYSPTTGDPVSQQIVVRDISGSFVRVLATQKYDFVHFFSTPQLSPNGTQAVWELYDDNAFTVTVRKSAVGAGGATTLKAGYSPYAFLNETTVLVQDIDGDPFTVPYAGGTPVAAPTIPVDAFNVTVSPDGTKLAWGLFVSSSPSVSKVEIATLDQTALASGVATVGTPATSTPGGYNKQPSFSADGSKVYFVHNDGVGGKGDVWSVNADGTGAAVTSASDADELDVAIGITDDGTAPADAGAAVPFTVNGTSATIRWTLPADSDLSGVIISRAGRAPWYVAAPNVAAVDTGLVVGTTYTYTIKAVDRSGNQAAGVTRQLRAVAPLAVFSSPTSAHSTTASFPVRFATGGTTDTTYAVQYRSQSTNWAYWVTGVAGATRTFGAPSGPGVNATTSTVGSTYSFSVRVVNDGFGNSSLWVGSTGAVVPWDHTKAAFSGGITSSSSSAYLGSFRKLTGTSQYAKVTLVGNQLQIVGWKCASCGSYAIYEGSTKIGTVNSYASSTVVRVVTFTKSYATSGTHTYVIRPLGTAGHPGVILDGFAMRR